MDSKSEERRDSEEVIPREPVFGPDAPPLPQLDPKEVRNSIYDGDRGNGRHQANLTEVAAEQQLRPRCIQGWFFRCSWSQKFNFIDELCELTTGTYVLEQVLRCIESIYSKDVVDSFARDRITYPYDVIPADDNRELSLFDLNVTKQDDALWFLNCDASTQIDIILKLLKLGGGGLIFSAYKSIDRMYRQRKEINQFLSAVGGPAREMENNGTRKGSLSKRKLSEKAQATATADVYTARKLEQIARRNAELYEFKKKYGLNDGPNGKAGNGKKKEPAEVIDYIQLLPIWLNRKIMLYLKERELAELKRTGRYWTKMIEDALRESAGRAAINARIARITGGKAGATNDREPEEGDVDQTLRKIPTWGRGAFLQELRLKNSDLVHARGWNEAFKGKKAEVSVWDDTAFERRCCCVNYQSKLLASSTEGKNINFHSLRTGARTAFPVVSCLPSTVTTMAIHDEGFHIVVGCEDGSLFCVNMRKNERTISYKNHAGSVLQVRLCGDKLLSAGEDRTIKFFDLWSGLCLLCANIDGSVTSAVFAARDGETRFAIAGTAEGKLIFIDLKRKRIHREEPVHEKEVCHIFVEGDILVTSGSDRIIKIWSLRHFDGRETPCELKPFFCIRMGSLVTSLHCFGYKIFAACADGRLRVICKLTGATVRVIEVTQKKPIAGIYVMQEKDTTKMITWHEGGIEMRRVTVGAIPKARKKRNGPAEKKTQPERRLFSLMPASAIGRVLPRTWRVKRYRGTDPEDREKVAVDMSCTVGKLRNLRAEGLKTFRGDAFTEMLRREQFASKERLMTFPRLAEKVSSFNGDSLSGNLSE